MNNSYQIEINKKTYFIKPNEFKITKNYKFNNLIILDGLSLFERITSILCEFVFLGYNKCIFFNVSHGGFLPIQCSFKFNNIYVLNINDNQTLLNLNKNIKIHNIKNINFEINLDLIDINDKIIVFSDNFSLIDIDFLYKYKPILITNLNVENINLNIYKYIYEIEETFYSLFITNNYFEQFNQYFKYFIEGFKFKHDNLINLCIMVKNAGPQFEDMLLSNLALIDNWTILDTGSTDETINIINKILLGKKRGNLYQKPFVNFRDSRNYLLELAGNSYKFNLILDDTYVLNGNLRQFLKEIRGDQFADSFSLYIKSDDVEYCSNRIIKSDRNLKYKFKIHEIIQNENNNNVIIPIDEAYILDRRFDYMEERTIQRKQLDIKLLFEELEDDPSNSRPLYYLAQTYNLLKNYDKSYEFFIKRMNHPNEGFIQEKIDAIFEAARLANFKLYLPWNICEELYLKAFNLDQTRPDSLYFIGIHYYLDNVFDKAFYYFKKAFEIGYPIHCQYSLKPTISFYFLPKFLTPLCYIFNNYELGEKSAKLFLENNKDTNDNNIDDDYKLTYDIILSWHKIYIKLNEYNNCNLSLDIKLFNSKPLFIFIVDGGFNSWTGRDILSKGIGGSETYTIEMATNIQNLGKYNVLVFCNCNEQDLFNDVLYLPILLLNSFLKNPNINVERCIISRFSEYLPMTFKSKIENIYLVLHDLLPSGIVLPLDHKLKGIFCLTEWHLNYFLNVFPQCKNITKILYNGINFEHFENNSLKKIKNKFIYSSFPNRGLLELLLMWPKIINFANDSSLHIYSDINGEWVNSFEPEKMLKIKNLLNSYLKNPKYNIYYYGWVNKKILTDAWLTSEYWFYPCTFLETFCITALEAAAAKVLCINNGLAALKNTVGERGIVIEGDVTSLEWQENALNQLFLIMLNNEKREKIININFEWVQTFNWKNQAHKFLELM